MNEYLDKIIQGDSLEVLKKMPSESVDMVITSPPYYGLRNYGVEGQLGLEKTFDEFMVKILAITAEIKRVLKKSGSFWLNFGDCYGGSNNGSNGHRPEGASISKNDEKYLGQKPKGQRLTYWGGNVEKSTLTNPERQQEMGRAGNEKCLLMQPERIAIAMIDNQQWKLRNKIKWAKQVWLKKQGRTVGSVMPSSVKDRFNESGEELYFFVKEKKYYFDLDSVRLPPQTFEDRPDGIDREKEYPNAKRNKFAFNYRVRDAERKEGQPQFEASEKEIKNYASRKAGQKARQYGGGAKDSILVTNRPPDYFGNVNGKNLPTIWQIGSEPHNFSREYGLNVEHFATFPEALVETPILAACPKNGIVLDPFSGSGTTLVVAKRLGRHYVGIELNENYKKLSELRLSKTPNPLF